MEKTREKKPLHPKHTTKATAARPPRSTQDGMYIKPVPRVSPYSPDSIDPGFVEIGLVQLSQSVKTMNATHTLTDTQTTLKMAPCTHPGMKRLFCLEAKKRPRPCLIMKRLLLPLSLKTASLDSLSRPCFITRREVNEARWPHTCSRPCAFEEKKKS